MKPKIFLLLSLAATSFTSCGTSTQNPPDDIKNDIVEVPVPYPSGNGPARNPYLAADKYAMSHFDPAQTDAFPYPIQRGEFSIDLRQSSRSVSGPVNIMTLATTDPNYMWAASSGSVSYVDVSNGGWKVLSTVNTPGAKVLSSEQLEKGLSNQFTKVSDAENVVRDWGLDWSRIANNVYSVVDKDNVLYATAGGKYLHAYRLIDPMNPAAGIKIDATLDLSNALKKVAQGTTNPSFQSYGAQLTGVSMTYDGNLVVLTSRSVSVVDKGFQDVPHTVMFGSDEFISNSMTIDENNGIYVASDKKMHKVVWTGSKLSSDKADGAWSCEYEFGTEPPSVKFGTGTGSTPTLMGFGSDPDKLVVITDGAKRMNVVAFWRNEIPSDAAQQPGTKSNRIAGQKSITCGLDPAPEYIQSEQSVVVNGYGAFVVNNVRPEGHKDKLVDVLLGGPVYASPRGAERVEWDPNKNSWYSVWTRPDVVATSMVPTVSTASNIVLTNGYTRNSGWEVTGMNWNTGQTVTRYLFGQDNLGNGAYAIIQGMPNGDLLFNSIGGPVRVKTENALSASGQRSR